MMRAKMTLREIAKPYEGAEHVKFDAVCGKPFGPDGESEDNTYARYTPSGSCELTITNPQLLNFFKVGQTFYLDFTEVVE
jgi:hypothetical protein